MLVVRQSSTVGKAVVYVMSRDQRVHDNHALLAAQKKAQEHMVPLYVLFVLKKVGVRSREHYQFMLEGLQSVQNTLVDHNIPFVLRCGESTQEILAFATEVSAGVLYFDFNPLPGVRNMVKAVAKQFDGLVMVVDTHNIIPAWVASPKQEFAAHTMRTKVHRMLGMYLVVPPPLEKQLLAASAVRSCSFVEAFRFTESIPASGIALPLPAGEQAARKHLRTFIAKGLLHYAQGRNNIAYDQQSGLSPYLHFGHISSLRVALDVVHHVSRPPLLLQQAKLVACSGEPSEEDGMNALLEEMIVRKELSDNFCLYSADYQSLSAAPDWAQQSLAGHQDDPRDYLYTLQQWEAAATHDTAWNAAQTELTKTGTMHGYMRMYWAKKILEWSATPAEALQTALYLNDKYAIDGGDPNGYVGVLWSIAGLHDRPWFERAVYGKIRYMNESGLRRKFAVDDYIQRVADL